ncbi:hydroxymethylglutaryl-CoA reductase, degradative [Dyella sp.]|uniref:hydroxymethylglutaryl-CoA reductase, degradative n=1 Tax=Dyella sp. TaxID=1869338 RepID=UPI002B4A4592|nr:hydroxymethylglutaryl-CoA reductase, degradative [Dyella sp.]HKT29326.1 hydroxymethylglutaryl-CoA reductase, degradative [Dyella sp.]
MSAESSSAERSRFPAFYKLSVSDRVRIIHERGWLSAEDYQALVSGEHTLKIHKADKMIENVVGVMGLPVGLGLNFLVNGRDYIVPLVVEEPSIVAALSSAAKLVRGTGGFTVESTEPVLIGQVQVVDVPHLAHAKATLLQRKDELLNLANSLHPQMVARGGGAQDLEVHVHPRPEGGDMLVVHLLVDTRDAMGANLVNTMCEGIASLVETMTGGRVFLRILSNLTDRSMVRARCVIPADQLTGKGFEGEEVRDGIVLANEFASIDPYRAATHNKGIMNGVDAVALATGNDWRAIESAAHAYAARGGRYTSLTRWYKGENGELIGELDIPMKVGTVGGPLQSNATVALNLRLLGVKTARELAEIMGAVGLAQNFSALRALVTEGIQQGHMTLHARSVAVAAGATPEIFDTVVERLVETGEIKIWKAQEIVEQVRKESRGVPVTTTEQPAVDHRACGHGKIILLGEHAVVYGSHAVAAPVPLAVRAVAQDTKSGGVDMFIPRWGVEYRLHRDPAHRDSFQRSLGIIFDELQLTDRSMRIEVFPNVPRAMGLGGSAAMAVAVIRALDQHYKLGLSDEEINALAFRCEEVAHGSASGIDNTVATYGKPLLYKRASKKGEAPMVRELHLPKRIPLVIGISGKESLTAVTVGKVRTAWQRNPALYDGIFQQIDSLTLQGVEAMQQYDLERLGDLMNICHGLLNALRVSSWEVEELVQIAREHGAIGAKLTGGGGGGSIVALCPQNRDKVAASIRGAGYQAMEVDIG